MPNTYEGGSIGVAAEAVTTITTSGVFYDLVAGSWATRGLQHFDNPAAGQLRNLGNNPREFDVVADFSLDSGANDELILRLMKWDASASTNVEVLSQTRQVNNFAGGRDVAFFNVNIDVTLDVNDYVYFQVANIGATNDVTLELDSYSLIKER
jgi:hypothetical protein